MLFNKHFASHFWFAVAHSIHSHDERTRYQRLSTVAFAIVYHWLSKMTPINFENHFFSLLQNPRTDSCFNYAWSRNAKMLIPRLNFIDLRQRSIKIDTITDTASHGAINREPNREKEKKGKSNRLTTISSGHSSRTVSQSASQSVSLSHCIHVYPMSFVRLISNEWWGIFQCSRLNPSSLWFTSIEMSTVFFLLLRCSTLWRSRSLARAI